jgi:hypothetical protein
MKIFICFILCLGFPYFNALQCSNKKEQVDKKHEKKKKQNNATNRRKEIKKKHEEAAKRLGVKGRMDPQKIFEST